MKKRISALTLALAATLSLAACGGSNETDKGSNDSAATTQSTTDSEPETNQDSEQNDLVLLDDDYIKATYKDIFKEDSIEGAFYLQILVENKSDTEITIALADAYVNNMSTTIGSGVPMTIQPGKSSQTPFIVFYTNLDITEIDELETIDFKFTVMDSDWHTLETSDTVSIPFT